MEGSYKSSADTQALNLFNQGLNYSLQQKE